jgi:hypothetical protein
MMAAISRVCFPKPVPAYRPYSDAIFFSLV